MEMVRIVRGHVIGVVVGLALGAVLFIGGVVATLSVMDVGASHEGDDVLHLCVSSYTGQARFISAGQEPNCNDNEQQVDLAGGELAGEVAGLREDLDELTARVPECLFDEDGNAVFEGCDVQVRNGAGETDTQNGTGNLIVGYNENFSEHTRDGSHNIVVGINHGYESYGGLVAGTGNIISNEYASVSGGSSNEASGRAASVSGGSFNDATGFRASISGGESNEATGPHSSVLGGQGNIAGGEIFGGTTVSGGQVNIASGTYSSISGGWGNETTEFAASISGGLNGTASEQYSSVSGGQDNIASAFVSTVGGGVGHNADDPGEFLP